ncbi:uncharacterized protein LOC135482435 isoform X2 [Lineus longissimus]|uniref:uncharacterized protein LOC135482435 isoform X2 n=1 Tax=Lineus longissimus TaxID=88925 RepID=UPI00315DCCEF
MNQLKELHGEVLLGLNITATWVDEELCERGVSRARRLSSNSDCSFTSPRRTPIGTPNGHGHRSSVGSVGFFAPRYPQSRPDVSPSKIPGLPLTSPTHSQGSGKSDADDVASVEVEQDAVEENLEDQDVTKSDCKTIFIGNVSFRATRFDLTKFFSKFGDVMKCYIVEDHRTRKSKGIAFLTFASEEVVRRILSATQDELYFQHRYLRVHLAEEKKRERVAKQLDPVTIKLSSPEMVEAEICGDSPIMVLNDDTLLAIFSYLSVRDKIMIERVCKRWNSVLIRSWVAQDHLHLRNLVQQWFSGITDQNLKSLLVRCPNLKSIDLSSKCRHLTDWSLEMIAQHCPKLMKLDLSGVAVTNNSLKTLSTKCTSLQWIKLSRCFDAGEKGLWWLFKNCGDLTYVNLEEDSKVTGNCFHVMGTKVKKLVLNRCGKLDDVAFEKLSKKCAYELEEMQISECNSVTDTGFKTFAEGLPNLKILHASAMYKVTAFGLSKLGQLKNLTHLYLSHNTGVSDSVLYRISQGCSEIRLLELIGCHQVTDAGMQCVSSLTKLESLNISYLHQIKDVSLELLAINCDLKTLALQACSDISNDGLCAIASGCHSLTDLDISGCIQISNRTLGAFLDATKDKEHPKLSLTIGGTVIDPSLVSVHDNIDIHYENLSKNFLRADRALVLPVADEFSDQEGAEQEEGASVDGDDHEIDNNAEFMAADGYEGDYVGSFDDFGIDDDAENYMDGDDPMFEERFDIS